MSTGFVADRATFHDRMQDWLVHVLFERGYQPQLLEPDGNRPDIQIIDRDRRRAYVDPKTRYGSNRGFAIKRGSFTEYWRLTQTGATVYVVWFAEGQAPTVDDVYSLTARITGGPRRPTGNGSRTDWLEVRPGGTPFNEFFPPALGVAQ